jgi:hypothetical protein
MIIALIAYFSAFVLCVILLISYIESRITERENNSLDNHIDELNERR